LNGPVQLESLVVSVVEQAGYRLVRFRVVGGKRKTLQVMAERADGSMAVEDCTRLSRALSEVLEAADPIEGDYVLEVSSPGIDRPLTSLDDFSRFAGHEARIELKTDMEGRRRFRGNLAGVENGHVVMDVKGEKETSRVRFAFADIAEAKLVLTDRLIQESLKAKDLKHQGAKAPH
jgi:ribosome maturation factor RimP